MGPMNKAVTAFNSFLKSVSKVCGFEYHPSHDVLSEKGGHASEFSRPLGCVEEMFAAYAEVGCSTFCVTAKIRGDIDRTRLEFGIDSVQRSHRQLAMKIRPGPNGRRLLVHSKERAPLKMLNATPTPWEEIVQHELTTPFENNAPLFRLTAILDTPTESTLILTFHHAIADGISTVTVLNDLLLAMSAPPSPSSSSTLTLPHPLWPSPLDDLLGPSFPLSLTTSATTPPPPFPPARNTWAAARTTPPRVSSAVLPPAPTARLIARAKAEHTTVHAALLAALARARARIRGRDEFPAADPLRILSPFNARPFLPGGPGGAAAVGLYMGGGVTAVAPGQGEGGFWDDARAMRAALAPVLSREGLLGLAVGVEMHLRRDGTGAGMAAFMRFATDHEALLSNLGRLEMGTVCGAFEVRGVWGPALRSCVQGEDNVATGTFGGRLYMVHSSMGGTEGLLEGMVRVLEECC